MEKGEDMNKIRSIQLLDDHKIAVELENGSSFVYNLKPRLQSIRFAALEDIEFFKQGRLVDNEYVWWSDSLMLYTYEMLDAMKK
ncbi:MAG: hypothetical protein APF76_16825 [Desulfitibacter sp. BRH_c19]|nr:MAG: hypothetical protein APF76_16825 [Desulfitibacter sp. BRH_c19]